ncbi:conserved hypothetical protein [Ricinus communis]|uniref:Uncharacterized protein n=1 Tax=Ricinus communis TaxID=3988 RepID=B9SDE6_RICCO|nr:conserved hypothetical protein [Ricinus communis]
MASRVLTFCIRHASLVRPLSESGKLGMARDMVELELTVGQNLFPVQQFGPPYRALRAFRSATKCDTSPLILLRPLQRNRLTQLQYSSWLDSQGEDQIWKGIKATLDDNAAKVRSRGDKEFSPVYPLMLRLGSSLTKNAPASRKP